MAVWDFVMGVLFGIIASCELPAVAIAIVIRLFFYRRIFRRAEFAKEEYSYDPNGRNGRVLCAPSEPAEGVHPPSVQADDHHQVARLVSPRLSFFQTRKRVARLPLLWNNRPCRRSDPLTH